MRQLTKIKLINWHYFSNETIPIEESALITGDNGAGKSTLIDAIQVVMIANMKKIKFNSSAFDEKTTRDLKGYLRGKTGSEGRNTYRRGEDDFSSYIVLEITHAKTGKQYLIGAVFDYFSGSGEEQHVFFKVDEQALVDDLFFEADVARNKQKFFHNLKVNGINHKQYANDIEGYRYDLRQLFGGVKESFFSLFSKGISFSPLTNLRSFVYDYILEERPVYVDTMRDYFEKFRQMENIIQDTNTEIECLERISRAFGEVENLRAQAEAGRYMRYRGSWEQNVRDLEKEKQELSATEARLEKLHLDLEQLEKRRQRLQEERDLLVETIAENRVARREKELKAKIEDLHTTIQKLNGQWKNLQHRVRGEIAEREGLADVLRQVGAPFEMKARLDEERDVWRLFLEGGAEFPDDLEEQAHGWSECFNWLGERRVRWKDEVTELEKKESELKEAVKALEDNRVLNRDFSTMKLKRLLEEHLVPSGGYREVPVHVFCEVIDIRDKLWRNAIEGYLHTQKFDLLVPPGYFDSALSVYERCKFSHAIENVGLVNTEKLLKEVRPPRNGSLAEEITAEEDYIRAYADRLLGGVIKCASERELKRHRRAITASCMLYQNYTARQIPKKRYETPYIGGEAVRLQLAAKRRDLEECSIRLSQVKYLLEAVFNVQHFEVNKSERYASWRETYEECGQRSFLESKLLELQEELMTQDRSELDQLERKKVDKEGEIQACHGQIKNNTNEIGKSRSEADGLVQRIEDLKSREAACRSEYHSYAEALSAGTREECERKWEKEIKSKSPGELERNYEISVRGLETRVQNRMQDVNKMRSDYVNEFNFPGDAFADHNEEFHGRCCLLKESHLMEYKENAREAREKAEETFKEHFVARLRESMELAKQQIEELNTALKDLKFGSDTYRFRLSPKPDMREYYDMINDSNLHEGETLFSNAFREKHGDSLDRLFQEITRPDEDSTGIMELLTDYRSYLDFEIVITDERGNKSNFSKVSRDKSGGETQVPFYVAILASFYQAYHLYRNKDTLRLVVFDEAFNRLDADNVEECIRFIRKLGFQAVIVAPTGKIQLILPHMKTITVVMRDGFTSFVERATRRDIDRWISESGVKGA